MALDWLPTYPDRFRVRPARGLSVSVQNLSPIPTAPPPTELTWHPTYPDWIPRPKRLLAQRSYFRLDGVPFLDLRWKASYPDRTTKPRLLVASQRPWFGPDFAFLQTPKIGQWRPTYPDRIWRMRPVPPTQTVYPIQGTTVLAGAICVEWAEVDLVRSMLTAEVGVRPALTEGTLVRSILDEEDVC